MQEIDRSEHTANELKETEGVKVMPKAHESDGPFWAKFISVVLHPMFMTVYGVCLLFIYTDFKFIFAGQFFRFLTPVVFLSCFVPISCLYILKRVGVISDYGLLNKDERFFPYFIGIICHCLLVFYFLKAGLYIWFLFILLVPIILLIIAGIITVYWKISVHMMGIGSLIGATLSVCYNVKGIDPYILFIILFILAGILGSARLVLNRHTQAQIYVGFLIGAVVAYLCVWIGSLWGLMIFMKNV